MVGQRPNTASYTKDNMKNLLFALLTGVIVSVSIYSCQPVYTCGCRLTVTTATGTDSSFYTVNYRFRAANKAAATSYCNTVYKDTLEMRYTGSRADDCTVGHAPM